jgi:hypothetical protein
MAIVAIDSPLPPQLIIRDDKLRDTRFHAILCTARIDWRGIAILSLREHAAMHDSHEASSAESRTLRIQFSGPCVDKRTKRTLDW